MFGWKLANFLLKELLIIPNGYIAQVIDHASVVYSDSKVINTGCQSCQNIVSVIKKTFCLNVYMFDRTWAVSLGWAIKGQQGPLVYLFTGESENFFVNFFSDIIYAYICVLCSMLEATCNSILWYIFILSTYIDTFLRFIICFWRQYLPTLLWNYQYCCEINYLFIVIRICLFCIPEKLWEILIFMLCEGRACSHHFAHPSHFLFRSISPMLFKLLTWNFTGG